MSESIPKAHVEMFTSSVLYTAQQKGSKLRGTMLAEPVVGKQGNAERIGKVSMQQKTARHADVPLISTPHSRRRIPIKDWHIRDLVDDEDRLKVIINAETAYSVTFGYAAGRKIDEESLTMMIGPATDGDGLTVAFDAGNSPSLDLGGADATLAISHLIDAKTRMIQNGVDPMETFHIAIGGAGLNDLLGATPAAGTPFVGNNDYNEIRALVRGEINFFCGFFFHILHDELLPAVGGGSDNRYCVFWSEFGAQRGDQKDPSVRIERVAEKNSTQVLLTSSFGVVRTDEARVGRIRIDA